MAEFRDNQANKNSNNVGSNPDFAVGGYYKVRIKVPKKKEQHVGDYYIEERLSRQKVFMPKQLLIDIY